MIIFGDIMDLRIADDIALKTAYPDEPRKWRKTKIAMCAVPEHDLFFFINTKSYRWAATCMYCVPKDKCQRLDHDSWLNLGSLHKASSAEYGQEAPRIWRLADESMYDTIAYMVKNSALLTGDEISLVLRAWEQWRQSRQMK